MNRLDLLSSSLSHVQMFRIKVNSKTGSTGSRLHWELVEDVSKDWVVE